MAEPAPVSDERLADDTVRRKLVDLWRHANTSREHGATARLSAMEAMVENIMADFAAQRRAGREEAAAWQPISTAPRDGTWVLGCGPHARDGHYVTAIHVFMDTWTITWMHDHGEPTHWMPLPPPAALGDPA